MTGAVSDRPLKKVSAMPETSGAPVRRDGRSSRPGGGDREAPLYGALDLGTNNCRLLVGTPVGDGFRVLESFSRTVRLGEGLHDAGRLGPAARR